MADNKPHHKTIEIEIESKQGIEQIFSSLEKNRSLFIINVFTKLGMVFLLLFGSYSWYQDHTHITAVTYGLVLLLIIAQQHAKRTKKNQVSQHLFVCIVIILYFFLLISGGVNNTGPLWCYPLLLLIIFTYGYPLGNYVAGGVIAVSAIFLYGADPFLNNIYSNDFRLRFTASLAGLFLVARFGENALLLTQTKIYQLSQEFYHASLHDPLTDLLNRRAIIDLMNYEYKRTQRCEKGFSIIMIDIDHFKKINDTYGHDCGDQVIKSVAQSINNILREQDQVSRWGGEEFLLLLPEISADMAPGVAEKIRFHIANSTITYDQKDISITVSIGVANYTSEDNLDDIIKRADRRLYQAKKQGRNSVV